MISLRGGEKRLVIHFCPTIDEKQFSLFLFDFSDLQEILSLVQCHIISEMKLKDCHSYLLGESSLFLWKDCLLLKTCGKTHLFHCIPSLLDQAKLKCNLEPLKMQYSH